jgi:hypothetical protein
MMYITRVMNKIIKMFFFPAELRLTTLYHCLQTWVNLFSFHRGNAIIKSSERDNFHYIQLAEQIDMHYLIAKDNYINV